MFFTLSKKEKKEKKKGNVVVRKENWIEMTHLRKTVAKTAEDVIFKLFDIYKKGHGMASFT